MQKSDLLIKLQRILSIDNCLYDTYSILKDTLLLNNRYKKEVMINDLLNHLSGLKALEKHEYLENDLTADDALFMIKYLLYDENVNINKIGDKLISAQIMEAIINNNKNSLIRVRVIKKITDLIKTTEDKKIVDFLSRDIFMKSIYLVNQASENKDKYLGSTLFDYKYNIMFLFPNIEEELLKNNFELRNIFILTSEFYAGLNDFDVKLFNNIRKNYIADISEKCINKIYLYDDTMYKYRYNSDNLEMLFLLMKSSLFLSSKDEINTLKEEYLNSKVKTSNVSNLFLKADTNIRNTFDEMAKEKNKDYSLNFANRKYLKY